MPTWTLRNGHLHKAFVCADFPQAIALMLRASFAAEALGHHPNWSNVYNRVDVELWTHDAGGLTDLDFQLAVRIDACVASP